MRFVTYVNDIQVSQFILSAIGSLPVSAYRVCVGVDCLEPRIVLMMALHMMFSFAMFSWLALSYTIKP